MNVSSNYASGPLARAVWKHAAAGAASTPGPAGDAANFAHAAALDRALQDTPDVRTNEVERARELINDPAYPSRAINRRVATLLAGQPNLLTDPA
jgi:hypothetical protein